MLKLSRKKTIVFKKKPNTTVDIPDPETTIPSRSLQPSLSNISYLICDEVSMVGCELLNEINISLQHAKNNTEPFRWNNHVILRIFYATLQHSPVGDKPLWKSSKK